MNKSNDGLKEVGKGLIAFANLFTVLSVINIYLKDEHLNFISVGLSVFIFISLYFSGYKIIKKGF